MNIYGGMSQTNLSVQPKMKFILEPPTSCTSLDFIRDDFDQERDQLLSSEPDIPMDNVTRQLLTYKIMRASQMLATGDTSDTVRQINTLCDMELQTKTVQRLLLKHGAIDTLVNLLEVEDVNCILGALTLIDKVASNNTMRLHVTNLGAIPNLIQLMNRPDVEVLILVAKVITRLCQVQKPARFFRKQGGIPHFIEKLDVPEYMLNTPMELLTEKQRNQIILVTAAAETLKQVSNYPKTIQCLHKLGLLLILKKLCHSCHNELLVEIFELLVNGVKNAHFRQTVEKDGILMPLVNNLSSDDPRMRTACARTIAECARDSDLTRHIVRMIDGLPTLVSLTQNTKQDYSTIAASLLAAAKLAQDKKNLKLMTDSGLVFNLIKFMKVGLMNEEIVGNVLEGLAQCSMLEENRTTIANSGIIPNIINSLTGTNPTVLTTAAKCLGTLAMTPEVAERITQYDGMRLLFSVMQSDDPSIPATALSALRPIVQNTKESAEELRTIMCSLTILTYLLSSENAWIVAEACGLASVIGKDPENLQILSDGGLVNALSECCDMDEVEVKKNLADAIAVAAKLRKNAQELGRSGVVPVMRGYLMSNDIVLHTNAMRALAALTLVPINCVLLHESNGVPLVLIDASAPSEELQTLATVVLQNMRRVALHVENKAIGMCDRVLFSKIGMGLTKPASKTQTSAFRPRRASGRRDSDQSSV